MSLVPVYFSHSYRREDRDLNDHFWRAFHDAEFSFTVDPGSTSLSTTCLELMMARSVGFVAVVTFRPEEEKYRCSPFILYEYGLAVQANRPRLVLRDKRVPPRYFRNQETVELEFDVAALDRCSSELAARLRDFRHVTGRLVGRRYRRGRVGIAIAAEGCEGIPPADARRALVERHLEADGDDTVDLLTVSDDPWELAQAVDGCDFTIVDLDDPRTSRIADFLQGRGTPMLKVARRSGRPITPQRLLGSQTLRRAAAASELVAYWDTLEEFESRVRNEISRLTIDRRELTDFASGHRYFRSLGREAQPVFLSNAASSNGLARELAAGLSLENIPFFHYRFQNTIGWGDRWTDRLPQMIKASRIFVPLIDAAYWDSEYCRREYQLALELAEAGHLLIVPALLDDHARGSLVPFQGTDLRDRPVEDQVRSVVSHLDELLQADTPKTTGDPGQPVEAGGLSVDIAIITILEEEYAAVHRLLRRVRHVHGSATLDNQHAWVVGEIDAPHLPVPYTVALAMTPREGTNAAAIATKNTLLAFDPRCVLVVGVAGGLDGLRLGDVVVADRVCDYEYGKMDGGFQPRRDRDAPTDAAIVSAARSLPSRHPNWYQEVQSDLSEESQGRRPAIVVGNVASGEKVVDDPTDDFFARVRESLTASSKLGLRWSAG